MLMFAPSCARVCGLLGPVARCRPSVLCFRRAHVRHILSRVPLPSGVSTGLSFGVEIPDLYLCCCWNCCFQGGVDAGDDDKGGRSQVHRPGPRTLQGARLRRESPGEHPHTQGINFFCRKDRQPSWSLYSTHGATFRESLFQFCAMIFSFSSADCGRRV